MAMAATCLNIISPSPPLSRTTTTTTTITQKTKLTISPIFASIPFSSFHHHLRHSTTTASVLTPSTVLEQQQPVNLIPELEEHEEQYEYDRHRNDDFCGEGSDSEKQNRQCELYVCNLPRSFDIEDLMEMFKPHGAVFSVEVSRSPETGLSRGCGFVTMGSIESAKAAITALDGIDVAGREMRVRFSVHMSPRTRNSEALNSTPVKNLVYESPYKLYVGNLAWAVQPHALRSHFGKFGTVASTRVLHDRKAGKNRAYGFISFSSAAERDEAASLDGTEFCGRRIIVRGLKEKA